MQSILEDKSLHKKLRQIFENFSIRNIPDDNLVLDKLVTWLESNLNHKGYCEIFVDVTNFWSCVSACLDDSKDSPELLWSLTLQLTGHVTNHHLPLNKDLVKLLFNKAHSCNRIWGHTCVRVAWLKGLSSMRAAVGSWLHDDDYLSTISLCLSDSSWFVRRQSVSLVAAAVKELVSISSTYRLDTTNQHSPTELSQTLDVLKKILKIAFCPLFYVSADDREVVCTNNQLMTSLEIIQCLDFSNADYWCSVFEVTPHILTSRFVFLLKHTAERLPQGNEVVLLSVVQQLFDHELCSQEVQQQIVPLMWSLLENNHVLSAISVAAWTFKWTTDVEGLESILLLPLWAAVSSEHEKGRGDLVPLDHRPAWFTSFTLLNSNKNLHVAAVKLSINCSLNMVNSPSYVHSICDFLLSTYDQSHRAHCLATKTNVRLFCLDACSALLSDHSKSPSLSCDRLYQVFKVLSMVVEHSLEDYVVLSKALSISLEAINEMCKSTDRASQHNFEGFLETLSTALERALLSPSWNIRDTVVEFLQKLHCVESESIHKWIIDHKWHLAIWQAVDDSDNFVRASSVLALGSLFQCQLVWSDFTSVHVPVEAVRRQVLGKLSDEASEFVRRSAVSVINQWLQEGVSTSDDVLRSMRGAIADTDRDVQLAAVRFWTNLTFDVIDAKQVSKESQVMLLKCLDSLILATSDYDRLVRGEALSSVKAVKHKLNCAVEGKPGLLTASACCSSLAANEADNDCVAVNDRSSAKLESVLVDTDWDQLLVVERRSIDECCPDTLNAILDDVLDNLQRTNSADDEIIVDCY